MRHATISITILLVAAAPGAMAFAGDPVTPVPPPSPRAGWLFDDGTGPAAVDSFAEYHGTLEGGMGDTNWLVDAPRGYAGNHSLAFDGLNDRVHVSDVGIISYAESSTVSGWFWWDDPLSTKEFAIYDERDECDFNIYALSIERRPGVENGLTFAVFDRASPAPCGFGSWQRVHSLIEGIATDTWHHAVGVLDEVEGLLLYLDGTLVATAPEHTAVYTGPTGPATIGHLHTLAYNSYWSGKLDEIAVFATALSEGQVLWLYEHGLAALVCTTDVDGSGDVGFGDILQIIGAWGPCGAPCPEDLNGNGAVDFADILAVIGTWGPCP